MRFSAERARFSAEQAYVNFSYKTAAGWLELAAPLNRISDWLFLNANDESNQEGVCTLPIVHCGQTILSTRGHPRSPH